MAQGAFLVLLYRTCIEEKITILPVIPKHAPVSGWKQLLVTNLTEFVDK